MKLTVTDSLLSEIEDGEKILWPISVVLKDGALTVTVCREARDGVSFLENMTEAELSSEKTLDRLISLFDGICEENGYEISYGKNRIYTLKRREDVNKSLILDSSEVLVPEEEYESLIDIDVDALSMGYLCFATVTDGTIISVASENPYREDESIVNIGVETAEEHRCKGYGASNVAALAYYLLDTGMTVEYTVDNENASSVRLAERVGFDYDRFMINIFAHKSGEENGI